MGCFFNKNERNAIGSLSQERIAAASLSNQEHCGLTDELKQEYVTLTPTTMVSRRLVSVQPNIDPDLINNTSEIHSQEPDQSLN